MKVFKIQSLDNNDALNQHAASYAGAQQALLNWVCEELSTQNYKDANLHITANRADLRKFTRSWGKTSRVQSTPVLNTPLENTSYKDHGGDNTGDYTEAQLKKLLENIEKI